MSDESTALRFNAADRVLQVIVELARGNAQAPSLDILATTFGLDVEEIKKDLHQVYDKLTLVRREVDFVESAMRITTLPENLYAPYLNNVRRAISVDNMGASWVTYRDKLGPDTILAIKYCAELIPNEAGIHIKELQSILDKVAALRSEIEGSAVGSAVRDFLLSQLAIIERAIHEYPLRGGKAINEAFTAGFSDLARRANSLDEAPDKADAGKIAGLWNSMKEAGKPFVETDRIANALISIVQKGQLVAGKLSELLSGSIGS